MNVGIGEILWDILPDGKVLGGAPANYIHHAQQTGLDSVIISAVGNDQLGLEILTQLKKRGLSTEYIAVVPNPTGTVQVTLKNGIPDYNITENVAWDNIPFSNKLANLTKDVNCVCFGTLAQRNKVSRATILKFLKMVPSDALKVYDINLRQNYYTREIIEDSLKLAKILKLNDEELPAVKELLGVTGPQDLMNKYDLTTVILTCGAKGSYLFTDDYVSYMRQPSIEVIDTVGAGDCFTAVYCASVLKGMPVGEAHKAANEAASECCTHKGAI